MAAGAFVFPAKARLNFFNATNLLGAIDQPPPVVNVTVPVPIVNVAPASVTVDVAAPTPVAYRVTVTDRDDSGLIRSFVIAPVL